MCVMYFGLFNENSVRRFILKDFAKRFSHDVRVEKGMR